MSRFLNASYHLSAPFGLLIVADRVNSLLMPSKLSFCSLLVHKNPLTEKLVKNGGLNPRLQKKWDFLTKNSRKLTVNAKKHKKKHLPKIFLKDFKLASFIKVGFVSKNSLFARF